MVYLPSEYQDYKYLVSTHDNYLLLSKNSHAYGESGDPATINCVAQYFTPSIYTIETTYTTENYETYTNISDLYTDSIFDRADFPQLFICNFIICLIWVFVINQLSKLVYKGGLFGSN